MTLCDEEQVDLNMYKLEPVFTTLQLIPDQDSPGESQMTAVYCSLDLRLRAGPDPKTIRNLENITADSDVSLRTDCGPDGVGELSELVLVR